MEKALVELFSPVLSHVLRQAGVGDPRPAMAQPPRLSTAPRDLLAGFTEARQQALTEALGTRFNGPQLFETLVRMCWTVVFPENVDDDAEADLKDREVRVIRHAGNAGRLIERIETLV